MICRKKKEGFLVNEVKRKNISPPKKAKSAGFPRRFLLLLFSVTRNRAYQFGLAIFKGFETRWARVHKIYFNAAVIEFLLD
jgi:hypothetical protein